MIFRKSVKKDYEQLENLFEISFGKIAEFGGALNEIEGRYIVAIDNERIVSCTGILPIEKSDYNGYEVTWTCTLPEYRHKGLIVKMLNEEINKLPNNNINLYCDCWHLNNKDKANLHNALSQIGFKLCIESRIKRAYPHSFECKGCLFSKENCKCSGDLYILKR